MYKLGCTIRKKQKRAYDGAVMLINPYAQSGFPVFLVM